MESTICTTETGLVLGVMSLEGEEDAAFTRGGASPDAGNPLDDAIGHGDEDGIEMVKKRDGLKPFERS